jgi:hypothetical protein
MHSTRRSPPGPFLPREREGRAVEQSGSGRIRFSLLRLLYCSTVLLSAALAAGCGPQVIYAPATGPVRLAENVAAHVYVRNSAGQWVKGANPVTLQAGEYVLQLPAATQP